MSSKNSTIIQARELRRTMSLPEVLLWQELRKRPGGYKFRRQHPIVGVIADFYCPAAKLVVEVDGAAHDMGDRPKRDQRRDDELRQLGLRTLRVPAADVLRDPEVAVRGIVAACQA
jgi:very-short-patch-repair endonuclease